MKPLVLHDIAEAVSMHESTISRVTTQKYMHTPRGIFELKYFSQATSPQVMVGSALQLLSVQSSEESYQRKIVVNHLVTTKSLKHLRKKELTWHVEQ